VRRPLTIALALVALGCGLAFFALRELLLRPLPIPGGEGMLFVVDRGASLAVVARKLEDVEVLPFPLLFRAVARATGADQRIRPGEYRLTPPLNVPQLLALLQSGETVRYHVTLPEGIRLRDALDLLHGADGLVATIRGIDDPGLSALIEGGASPEGYFLPETYQYRRGDTDLDVLRQAHGLARDALGEAWAGRDPGLPYATPYEVLIMASIIEKETGVPEERAQIAGVFTRRLQRGMRLQTDPTVIYGLGDGFDGNLTRAHLRDEANPYNTYRHHGLPPSPIALPGREALAAAVHPAPGDALYFVARGDGTHVFSATLEAHERAVDRYQRRRNAAYRSSPGRRG
jgi:UPF0755 protein